MPMLTTDLDLKSALDHLRAAARRRAPSGWSYAVPASAPARSSARAGSTRQTGWRATTGSAGPPPARSTKDATWTPSST